MRNEADTTVQQNTILENNTPKEDGRIVEENFDLLPTHIKGFFVLVDHNVALDSLTRGQTRGLKETGVAYGIRAKTIKKLQALQKDPHKELVDMGINIPGLRGGRDLIEGVEIQINPQTIDIFDENLLDESLGSRRPEVVHKKVTITIELDPDKDDIDGFVAASKRRLRRQGFSANEAREKVKIERELRVDKNILADLISKNEITLIPGAWNIQTTKWNLVPRQTITLQEQAEAQEVINFFIKSLKNS